MIDSLIIKVHFEANYSVVQGQAILYIGLPNRPKNYSSLFKELKQWLAFHLNMNHGCIKATKETMSIVALAHEVSAEWETGSLEDGRLVNIGEISNVEIRILTVVNGEY